ncbi:major capsid protein [Psychrobacter sp. DM4]|uniref:major capsid protein n=1 Tax=Psychrobacter sp. DM4 TaxID=3440637 RepID=UPI003F4F433C
MSQSKIAKVKSAATNKYYQVGTAATMALVTTGAHAEGVAAPDMTPIVTMINGLVAVVGSVGMAVLSVYATAKVFKWVKTAF